MLERLTNYPEMEATMAETLLGATPEETLNLNTTVPRDFFELLYDRAYPSSVDRCRVPRQETSGVAPLPMYKTLGLAQVGTWYTGNRRCATLSQWLLIHWPSLLRGAVDTAKTFPPAALLLWCFKDLFIRRSYNMGELFERYLSACVRKQHHPLLEYSRVPMSDGELAILRGWLHQVSLESVFLDTLKTAFDEVVADILCPTKGAPLAEIQAEVSALPDYKPERFSLLALYTIPTRSTWLPPTFAIPPLKIGLFGPAPLDTLAHEIFLAWRFLPVNFDATAEVARMFGVMTTNECSPGSSESQPVLTINFARFYRYRSFFDDRSRYDRAVFAAIRRKKPQEDVLNPAHIVSAINDKYLRLATEGIDLKMRDEYYGEAVGHIWPGSEWAASVFLKQPAVKNLWQQCFRRELSCATPIVRSERVTRIPKLHTRTFKSSDGAQYSFSIIKHTGQYWFSPLPPLEVFDRDRGRTIRRYKGSTRTVPKEGTYYSSALRMWFYSARCLTLSESFSKWSIPGLDPWLLHMAEMSSREFKDTNIAVSRKRVGRHPFSLEEDNAIQRYYYPGMSTEARDALMAVCFTRSSAAVSMRASVLCDSLIDTGVYEKDKLPHLVYNARLGRRIAAAKAAAKEKSK